MGEITRQSEFGNGIYNFIKNLDNCHNIVEIGGWDGTGTTKCVYDALIDSKKQLCHFYSLEIVKDRHNQAVKNFSRHDSNRSNIYLHFLNNSLCGPHSDYNAARTYVKDHYEEFQTQQGSNFVNFYEENLSLIKSSRRILERLPKKIDILILDGGEYTTYHEWQILKEYADIKYLILDDIKTLKCKYICDELIDKKALFKTDERNGGIIINMKENI